MSEHSVSFDVRFRHIGRPTDAGEFSYIGLFYDTKAVAEAAADKLGKCLSAPGGRTSRVAAVSKGPNTISLSIEYACTDLSNERQRVFSATMPNVDRIEFNKILDAMTRFVAYGIIIGWEETTGPELMDPRELSVFRTTIDVDGELVRATGKASPPR